MKRLIQNEVEQQITNGERARTTPHYWCRASNSAQEQRCHTKSGDPAVVLEICTKARVYAKKEGVSHQPFHSKIKSTLLIKSQESYVLTANILSTRSFVPSGSHSLLDLFHFLPFSLS